MPSLFDYLERSITGPIMTQKDFQMKILIPNVRKIVNEFEIKYDPDEPVSADNDLADRLFDAAIEFLALTGLYCDGTNRVIAFDRNEIKRFEINKDRFNRFEDIIVVDRPKNAERIFIDADVGDNQTEIVVHSEVADKYNYLYRISLYNLIKDEQFEVMDWLIQKLKANVIGLDCGDALGRILADDFEKKYSKDNVVRYAGASKLPVDFEKDEMVYEIVTFEDSDIFYFYNNIDHTSEEMRKSLQIYDQDHIGGLPMFSIVTLGYDHGIIKPYYTSLYGTLNVDNNEDRIIILKEIIQESIDIYNQNRGGYNPDRLHRLGDNSLRPADYDTHLGTHNAAG